MTALAMEQARVAMLEQQAEHLTARIAELEKPGDGGPAPDAFAPA